MPDELDLRAVERDIEALDDAHRRLVDHLSGLDGVDSAQPSLLEGWTLGHVLSHIARNGDSVLRMLNGLPQYWGGLLSRQSDIELGAGRPWDVLVDDIVSTNEAVVRRMREVTDWSGSVQATTGLRLKAVLPLTRQREVEIHRFDLGLGYGFDDMPALYIRSDLHQMEMRWNARKPMGMTTLPPEVQQLGDADRLAWLMGRKEVKGVPPAGVI